MSTKPRPSERAPLAIKLITLAMIAVQAFAAWYLLGTFLFPAMLTAIFAWLLFTELRFELPNSTRFRLCAVLAVVFIIKSRVAPLPMRQGVVTSLTQVAHVAGQLLMVLQLLLLATSRNRQILPQVIPWLGALTMICAGDIYVTEIQRAVFQMLVVIFVTLATAFSAMNREMFGRRKGTARTIALGVLMAAVGITGWVSASSLYSHSRDIEDFVQRLVEPQAGRQQSGFTTKGRLQSIVRFREENADGVAMHVRSDLSPGYLRGFVFGEYTQREWIPDKSIKRTLQPTVLGDVKPAANESVFYLQPGDEDNVAGPVSCWPISDLEAVLFLPPQAKCVVAELESIAQTGEGNVMAPDLPIGYPYRVYSSNEPESRPLSSDHVAEYKYLDILAAPKCVSGIARKLFADSTDFSAKTTAVVDYFSDNFEYSLNFEAPPGADPINWFLTREKNAHCEYFATAATMLLRAGGIPARYVTGFVVTEQNSIGEYWVVRNKHAHAWVEAYDADRQRWVIVEATPPDGVPQADQPGQLAQMWDYIKDRYQVFRVRLHQRGLLWAIGALLSSWLVRALLGLLLVWIFIRLRRFNKTFVAPRLRAAANDPHARAFRRVLHIADAKLRKRHGLIRDSHETLHQFATRVADAIPNAADFYRSYAQARYSPSRDELLPELKQVAKGL